MYATGNFNNFMSRLHQMPVSVSDMVNFVNEGDLYLSTMTIYYHLSGAWEKEAERKLWKIYNDPVYLTTKVFGGGFSFNYYLLNEDGSYILDENGNKIKIDEVVSPITDAFGNTLVDRFGNIITD